MKGILCFISISTFLLLLCCVTFTFCSLNDEEKPTLTDKEEIALEKFKASVHTASSRFPLAKDDFYLIRWLRAQSLNVSAAEKMFQNHMTWRKLHKIESIKNENWTTLEKEYPVLLKNTNKNGMPVLEVWFSEWNVLHAIYSGYTQKLIRWVIRILELSTTKIYSARAENKNITQGIVLIDLKRFDTTNQGCPSCIGLYKRIMSIYENYYPHLWHSAYIVNAPLSFNNILQSFRDIRNPSSNKSDLYKVYKSKNNWMPVLDEIIDKTQRSPRFGGGTFTVNHTIPLYKRVQLHKAKKLHVFAHGKEESKDMLVKQMYKMFSK